MMGMSTFCPYVGVGSDRMTRAAYPSGQNTCYARSRRGKDYTPVSKMHQAHYCLADQFRECPYWPAAKAG